MPGRRDSRIATNARGPLPRPSYRRPAYRSVLPVLAAVSVGGILGSLGRYGVLVALPYEPDEFAWATFGVNVPKVSGKNVFRRLTFDCGGFPDCDRSATLYRPHRLPVHPLVEQVPEEGGGVLRIGHVFREQVPQDRILGECGDQRIDDPSTFCRGGKW